MPKLLAPRTVTREYEIADGDVLTVSVRQATGAEELKRDQILNTPIERSLDDSNTVKVHIPTPLERTAIMAWLVLEDTNIQNHDGKPLFVKGMSLSDFKNAWAAIPGVWRDLIMETVLEANPDWMF